MLSRMGLSLTIAEQARTRLEQRLQAQERQIGSLENKVCAPYSPFSSTLLFQPHCPFQTSIYVVGFQVRSFLRFTPKTNPCLTRLKGEVSLLSPPMFKRGTRTGTLVFKLQSSLKINLSLWQEGMNPLKNMSSSIALCFAMISNQLILFFVFWKPLSLLKHKWVCYDQSFTWRSKHCKLSANQIQPKWMQRQAICRKQILTSRDDKLNFSMNSNGKSWRLRGYRSDLGSLHPPNLTNWPGASRPIIWLPNGSLKHVHGCLGTSLHALIAVNTSPRIGFKV